MQCHAYANWSTFSMSAGSSTTTTWPTADMESPST